MPRAHETGARFGVLTAAQQRALLTRNHVGRLGFVRGRSVDIEPVHYVAVDGWIFVRSASGTRLEALMHNPYVAFEIDEVDGLFDWRSVVVHGTAYFFPGEGSPAEQKSFMRAVRALRSFLPRTMTGEDPTPFRDTVFGIHIDTTSGRSATPGPRTRRRSAVRSASRRLPTAGT
jgi:nitroimidazol reductase NimA-like FMN-containing flavoprotein (pyridoxamine 5'-phosphate oxidase superfamily)